jgi:hypothetical protein
MPFRDLDSDPLLKRLAEPEQHEIRLGCGDAFGQTSLAVVSQCAIGHQYRLERRDSPEDRRRSSGDAAQSPHDGDPKPASGGESPQVSDKIIRGGSGEPVTTAHEFGKLCAHPIDEAMLDRFDVGEITGVPETSAHRLAVGVRHRRATPDRLLYDSQDFARVPGDKSGQVPADRVRHRNDTPLFGPDSAGTRTAYRSGIMPQKSFRPRRKVFERHY